MAYNIKKACFCSMISFITISVMASGCRKLLEIDSPANQIVGKEIYRSNATAISVLTGIYIDMSNYGIFTGRTSITNAAGLSADEFVTVADESDILGSLYKNNLTNNGDQLFWSQLYAYIFRINSAIEGITESSGVTSIVKERLIGEAKFLRAFMYFYLINMYGDAPLILTTDVKLNSNIARTSTTAIYEQIVQDLKDAQRMLSVDYVSADLMSVTSERTRPNQFVATALLSRVYLYLKKWELAEAEATKIIEKSDDYGMETLDNCFLSSSKEAIWQLQPVGQLITNTIDASIFVLASGISQANEGPDLFSRPIYLSNLVYGQFENGDQRKIKWVDSVVVNDVIYNYPHKYKAFDYQQPRTEYLIVFRLSEQFLIRAEARAQQGKLVGSNSSSDDINVVRLRAGLSPVSAFDLEDMLEAIAKERFSELFSEWGHRWFDLKRTNSVDKIMMSISQAKGITWSPYKQLYPLPLEDIQRNPKLRGAQNPGYPAQ